MPMAIYFGPRTRMGHPTDTQIFKAIKEGIAEVLEQIKQTQIKLAELEEKIDGKNN